MRKLSRVVLLTISISPFISTLAFAGGFQNFEQNASDMGNAYSGVAAAASDASIGFYNPAGLVLFKTRQVTYSTAAVFNKTKFTGNSLWRSYTGPFTFLNGSASSNKTQYLPAFNEAIPFNNRFAVGLNVGIPYSFESNFSNNSVTRYETTQSHFYVVDISPSMAYLIEPKWSAGIGADFDYAHADFDSTLGFPNQLENKGGDWGVGWHGGVLYQYSTATNFGLAYHSPVNFNLSGDSKLTGPITGISGASLVNSNLHMKIKTPASVAFSASHDLNQKWQLLGSVNFTDWSQLNNIKINNSIYVINGIPVAVNTEIPLHLRNSWYTAVGTNYKMNSHFTLRGGLGFDESPATSATSLIIPSSNNLILATGIQYNLNKMWGFDLGYQHWFAVQNSNRNTFLRTSSGIVSSTGQLKQNVNLVGLQITWNIGML